MIVNLYFKMVKNNKRKENKTKRRRRVDSKMEYMKQIFPVVKMLSVANPETRSALLTAIDRPAFHAVCECVQNIVSNPDIISSAQERESLREKVGSEKKRIRQFLHGKMSLSARRKKGIQIGGFLGTLLRVGLPILAQLIFSSVSPPSS